jgi:coenzyme F420-reducing hydrogenase beta subunit
MRIDVLWTNLSRPEISRRLGEMGTPCHRHTVRKLLRKHKMGQRKARKKSHWAITLTEMLNLKTLPN